MNCKKENECETVQHLNQLIKLLNKTIELDSIVIADLEEENDKLKKELNK